MRKYSLLVAQVVVLVGVSWFYINNKTSRSEQIADWYKNYIANMPTISDINHVPKEDRPDLAFEFDKLKRINPLTGEIPEDGLKNAWLHAMTYNMPQGKVNFGALNWEERGPNNVGGRTRAIMYDPNDAQKKRVFAGGVGGGLWVNDDITSSSSAWSNVDYLIGNVAITTIGYDPSNTQVMYFGTGESWGNIDALQGNGVYKSTDGGDTWNEITASGNASLKYVNKLVITSSGYLYIAAKNGLYKSTDGGASVKSVLSGNITDLEIGANGDLYAAKYGGIMYKSAASLGASQGESGQWVANTIRSGGERVEFACAPSNSNYLYALVEVSNTLDKVYRSTDGGLTWAATSSEPNDATTNIPSTDFTRGQAWYDLSIAVDPSDHQKVYAGGINIFKSTNSGDSWQQISSSTSVHADQHAIVFKPGSTTEILFGCDGGIYYTSNGGSSFSARNNNYNVTQFYSLAVNPTAGSNVVIGGTQDNGTQRMVQAGVSLAVKLLSGDGAFTAIAHDNPNLFLGSLYYARLYRSSNGGTNFSGNIAPSALNDNNTMFINPFAMDPNNSDYLYYSSNSSLWRHNLIKTGSTAQWAKCTGDIGTTTAIGISKSTPNLVYAAAGGRVYRIPNADTTSVNYMPDRVGSNSFSYISCVAVNPNDGNHIVVCISSYGGGQLFETRDADQGTNATWKSLAGNLPNVPVNWAVFEPGTSDRLVIGTDIGAFRSTDITQASAAIFWSHEGMGMGFPRIDMLAFRSSDNTIFAATHGRGIFQTSSLNFAPTANFDLEADSVCSGLVTFTDSSTNAPNTWHWYFGDGTDTISSVSNITHEYTSSGNYNVSLVVENGFGSDSIAKTFNIFIYPTPNMNITSSDTSICSGETITLMSTGDAGLSYEWLFTNASDPYQQNIVINPTSSQQYILKGTSAAGCTVYDTVQVSVTQGPPIWAGLDVTITEGDTALLEAVGADYYIWTPSTGLSDTTIANPKANPTVTTTYTVTGYDSTTGCSKTDYVKVTVVPKISTLKELSNDFGFNFFPNPIKDKTTFSFYLDSDKNVKITLYGVNGQVLESILNENLTTGEQSIIWEPKRKKLYPSGTYFIQVQVGDAIFHKRLLIIE